MPIAPVACIVLLSAGLLAGQASPVSDPLEFYKGYLVVLAKAKTLDELLPYYGKDLAASLGKMPKEMQGNYLKMNARVLTDLQVTRQSGDANRAQFEMTAKTADGSATSGTAVLVREGGGWKVDNEAWIGPPPP